MSNYGDIPNSKKGSLASSRTFKYAQQLAITPTSANTAAATTEAVRASPASKFSSSSTSSQTTEIPDLLLAPWPGHSKAPTIATMSSWDISLTPRASVAGMSPSPGHTYQPLLPSDYKSNQTDTQIAYSTSGLTKDGRSYQLSSPRSMISSATLRPDDSVSYLGRANDQTSISPKYYHQSQIQTPPLPTPWLIIAPPPTYILPLPPPGHTPTQWFIIAPPPTYFHLLPPSGYTIFQPPSLDYFKPSDAKPKTGVVLGSYPPNDWQYRTVIQREAWVEMDIFQKVPIIRKKPNRSIWRCGWKGCKWSTKGDLGPILATEYLVHQFEAHESSWSLSDEGRVHLNRLKQSLSR